MKKQNGLFCGAFVITAMGLTGPVSAAENNSDSSDAKTKVLDKVMVIGNPANIEHMPGSAQFVSKEDIRQQNYDDVNRVLRKVPGVYVREEDGFGLFPNISLRGVDTTRNAKVTIMEDGVMMAPAPYSSPAAYYSPTTGRMSGLEVLKGSSQVKYGPHTTGGVVNYLSTPIPTKETAYLKSTLGSFNEQRTHLYFGDTVDTDIGQIGMLVEGYRRQSDGFKTIDETPDFRNGNDTGFDKTDSIIKLSWEPDSNIYQRLEFKYGQSELDANETYLGLSEADFKANPTRRYAASRFDNMVSKQKQNYLRYTVSPNDDLDIITTLYNTEFKRNWYKLKDLRNVSGNTIGLSAALAGAQSGEGLDCLKGDFACTLRVRANNRSYESKGIESIAYYRFGSDSVRHEITAGIRSHQDQVRRFQWDDDYTQAANGTISAMTPGTPGGAGDRLQRTKALALFVQDTIETGAWTITPGIRYEMLDQTYESPLGTFQGDNKMNLMAGGMGLAYKFNESWTGFGGLHKGFSPPSPKGAVSGLKEETSVAFEAGTRYANPSQALSAEAVAFYTNFKDLIVVDNVGGAGTGDDENFGEVDTYGLEFALQYDAGIANNWKLRNPWFLTITYTNATQQNDATSTDAESIFSFGKAGNKLPYIPELAISLGTGVESKSWGAYISANYVSETYTSANNVDTQLNGLGNPDSRFGKTDSYFVTDVSAFYRVSNDVKLFAGVQNLFDETYIVSRQPAGPRGGLPQFVYAGIEVSM